jgi:glycosyltransferase involved in cell wall biosynthesis
MEMYSVLMSVYWKEKPDYLLTAIESMTKQTIPFHDFVLVCDGSLTDALTKTIDRANKIIKAMPTHPVFTVVPLTNHSGLGSALNIGLNYCQCDLIARMDSDDISLPNRCERQLKQFELNPNLSIVSGTIIEFSKSISEHGKCRKLPENQDDIVKFAKSRNPFNHPCVMYRKSAVIAAGSYRKDYPYFEDYDLWLRMLWNGAMGYNIPEPLLYMRAGNSMYKRRGGSEHFQSAKKLFSEMKQKDFITSKQYYKTLTERWIGDHIPSKMRAFLYQRLLRY